MGFHNDFHNNNHIDSDETDGSGHRGRPNRQRRGRGPGGHGGRGPGGPSHRQRARRGAVADGVLLILADTQPLHGYELISELEERSENRWRPSPGSMYPTLRRLEEKGLILGEDDGEGKRFYSLTDEGNERVAKRDPDEPLPWAQTEGPQRSGVRPLVAEVMSQVRHIGRFGAPEQREQVREVMTRTRDELAKIMAP